MDDKSANRRRYFKMTVLKNPQLTNEMVYRLRLNRKKPSTKTIETATQKKTNRV